MPRDFSRVWKGVVAILKSAAPAPTDSSGEVRRMTRRFKIASFAAVLLLLTAGWALSRSEIVKPAERATPHSTRTDRALVEAKQALQDERAKSEKLARQLSTAWAELQSQAVALGDGAARSQELADLRQALQLQSEAYREILAMESARNRKLEDQLEAQLNAAATPADTGKEPPPASVAPSKPAVTAQAKPEAIEPAKVAASAPTEITALPAPDRPSPSLETRKATFAATPATETPATIELPRLLEQARLLIRRGDIGAARTVLEHAAGMGNAAALFALAETYDPDVLSDWGTLGTVGDAAKAQELYAAAVANGLQEVNGRLSALGQ